MRAFLFQAFQILDRHAKRKKMFVITHKRFDAREEDEGFIRRENLYRKNRKKPTC